uniref:DNA-(apurinic or apyrimidinic site) endonuclease n=1 Tax=Syphacia muris TaxID=451379 RepID=A0A0N5AAE9_9BILA
MPRGRKNAKTATKESSNNPSMSRTKCCLNEKSNTVRKSVTKKTQNEKVKEDFNSSSEDSKTVESCSTDKKDSSMGRKRKARNLEGNKKNEVQSKAKDSDNSRKKSRRDSLADADEKSVETEGEVASSTGSCLSNLSVQPAKKMWKTLKILSWNVAGLRAWVKKDAHQILYKLSPDIFGLQEIKCNSVPEGLDLKGYYHYLESPVGNVGRAGVMLLTKQKPSKVVYGSRISEDATGRLIFAEFDAFYLVNAYVPNSGRGLVNLGSRKLWEDWFINKIKELDAVKPVIYTGDLNVAHQEIDLANPKTNKNKTAGFTDQERDDFTRLLDAGFIDVYRKLNPEKTGAYTFWSNMHGARGKNVGWRLDYFIVSKRIFGNVKKCEILSEYMGSDHCPISLEISI